MPQGAGSDWLGEESRELKRGTEKTLGILHSPGIRETVQHWELCKKGSRRLILPNPPSTEEKSSWSLQEKLSKVDIGRKWN